MCSSIESNSGWGGMKSFQIELPSWGFANTGTRFGKFLQRAAATTTEEKLSDAGEVHRLTGVCPTVALHVLWDLPDGPRSVEETLRIAKKYGVRPGSVNPNVFQDQIFKHGSLGNPDPQIRETALDHIVESIAIARQLATRDISLWFADASNYPGTANIRHRRACFEEALQDAHAPVAPDQRLFLEYN